MIKNRRISKESLVHRIAESLDSISLQVEFLLKKLPLIKNMNETALMIVHRKNLRFENFLNNFQLPAIAARMKNYETNVRDEIRIK